MSEMMSNIGGWIGNNTKVLNPLLTGAGVVSNFLQGRKQNSYNDAILQNAADQKAILNDPAKLAAKIAMFRHPLNQGLVSGVENATQGYLAERGLSAAPTIQEQVMAQALGPYVNQNENSAMDAALRSLGIPYAGMQPKFAAPANLTGLLQSILKGFPSTAATSSAGGPVSTAGLPFPSAPNTPPFQPADPSASGGNGQEGSFGDFDWSSLWNMVPAGDAGGFGGG